MKEGAINQNFKTSTNNLTFVPDNPVHQHGAGDAKSKQDVNFL